MRHSPREAMSPRFPLLVTVALVRGLPPLRNRPEYSALRVAFSKGCERDGFRLVHYSLQNDHMHLIVEGRERTSIALALQGLLVRIARTLNRVWQRNGSVFRDRYHDRVLRTPREVRNALSYVLNNARKHGHGFRLPMDPFASGPWFDGWREEVRIRGIHRVECPVVVLRTWLLCVGWRRHGLIGLTEVPGRHQPAASG